MTNAMTDKIVDIYDLLNAQKRSLIKFEQYTEMFHRTASRNYDKLSENLCDRETYGLLHDAIFIGSEMDALEEKIKDTIRTIRTRHRLIADNALNFLHQKKALDN